MTYQNRLEDEDKASTFCRSDRFLEKDDGYYIRLREGVDGPHPDLASALNGLMRFAEQNGLSRYQTRKLYESVCQKALSMFS